MSHQIHDKHVNYKTPARRISGSGYETLGVDFLPNLDFQETECVDGKSVRENVLTDQNIWSMRFVLQIMDQDDDKDEDP